LKEAQRILAETQDVACAHSLFLLGLPAQYSTVVPEGMRAYAGIGCHYMAQWMDRSTLGYTQMGGEGANWIGEARSPSARTCSRISATAYLQPLRLHGDPRRYRLGRQHYLPKILFNDAVAMTARQANDGGLTVDQIARQVAAEGAKKVVVVTRRAVEISAQHGLAARADDPSPR